MCGVPVPGNDPKGQLQGENERVGQAENQEGMDRHTGVIIDNDQILNNTYIIPPIAVGTGKEGFLAFNDFDKNKNSAGLKRPIDEVKAGNQQVDNATGKTTGNYHKIITKSFKGTFTF